MRRSVVKLMLAGVVMVVGTAGTCEEWCHLNHDSEFSHLFCEDNHETGSTTSAAEESLAEADVEAELEELGL